MLLEWPLAQYISVLDDTVFCSLSEYTIFTLNIGGHYHSAVQNAPPKWLTFPTPCYDGFKDPIACTPAVATITS